MSSSPPPLGHSASPGNSPSHPPVGVGAAQEHRDVVLPATLVRPRSSAILPKVGDDGSSEQFRKDVDRVTLLFLQTLDDMEAAGLADHYEVAVHQSMRAYMTIMDGVWEALAEERLTEAVTSGGYRHELDQMERWLNERRQRCAEAIAGLKARGAAPPRPSYVWRSRAKLYRAGLRSWEQTIDTHGDAHAAGQGLFRLHGFFGLTVLNKFELWGLDVLRWAGAGVATLVLVAFVIGIPFIQGVSPVVIGVILGFLLMVAYYVVRLNVGARGIIQVVIGYALAPRQKVSFSEDGLQVVPTAARRRRIRRFLEGWSLLVLVSAPFTWLLATAAFGVLDSILATKAGGEALISISGVLTVLLVLILPLSYLFFLPFVVTTQMMLSRDLAEHPDWEVPARRYPLRFSLTLLPFIVAGALVVSIILRQAFSLQDYTVFALGSLSLKVSTLLYLLAFLLPYALLIDFPYRFGVSRWRMKHLKELRGGRRVVEEEIARLPLKHEAKDDLHELEYHLGWLEYYQMQITEVEDKEESPFPVERRTFAFLLATPLPLILAAVQDISSGQTLSKDVFEVIQRLLSGGK